LIFIVSSLKETHMSTLHDAEYWRKRAEEIRVQAKQIAKPEYKRDLLDIATGYERLAKLAEEEKLRGGVSTRAA
jgi:hypothetical protein